MKYPRKESSTLEFKESYPRNNQIVKTIVGFCNQKGGKIVIGVKDDGTIVGVPEKEIEYILEHLNQKIFETTSPPIIPRISTQLMGDQTLLNIEVSSGMNKPYYITSEGRELGTYVRLGRSTLRATQDIIEELSWESQGRSYDTMPVYHARVEDLDIEKIKSFLLMRKYADERSSSVEGAMKSYQLITEVHAKTYPTVAGILLFGHDPNKFFSEAFIACNYFAGIEGRKALATKDATGTLFDQYEIAYNFLLRHLDTSFTIEGSHRIEKYEVPTEALREAIINAIIHRNYNLPSAIKIAIYDNRIEIYSPGSFPGPIDQNELQMGFTYTRNKAIARIFREAGLCEKLGSGFITIFSSYEKRGLPSPEFIEGANFVKCILPRPYKAREIYVQEDDLQDIMKLFEMATDLTIGDVVVRLNIPRSTAGRRLSQLVKMGHLRKVGIGRGTRYRLIK